MPTWGSFKAATANPYQELCVYELHVGRYVARSDFRLPELALSLTIWEGTFEDKQDHWLRWCNISGDLLPTGAELAELERHNAEEECQRAEEERLRAEEERQRADAQQRRADEAEARAAQMAAKLRSLGIDPELLEGVE